MATSELTVSERVIGLTPGLQLRARRHVLVNGQRTDAAVGGVRDDAVVLRLHGHSQQDPPVYAVEMGYGLLITRPQN